MKRFVQREHRTPGQERRVTRWEDEAILEATQTCLDRFTEVTHVRRQTVEHPLAMIKVWMGSAHFLTMTLKRITTEMSLHVLAYHLKRVMKILGIGPLMQAIRAWGFFLLRKLARSGVHCSRFEIYIQKILNAATEKLHQTGLLRWLLTQCSNTSAPVPMNFAFFTRPGPGADIRVCLQSSVALATFPWQHTTTHIHSTTVAIKRKDFMNLRLAGGSWPPHLLFAIGFSDFSWRSDNDKFKLAKTATILDYPSAVVAQFDVAGACHRVLDTESI
jgi:hypothetical protein